jgi:micrococcal nuclease
MSWMEFMMKRLIIAFVVVVMGMVLASPAQAYPAMPQGVQGPYTVLRVVDGDTIHVSVDGKKLKIRMIGLDTPEVVDPRKPVQCFGREASAQAKTILGGQQVYLETDPSQDSIDKYGRTLVYVWTESGRLFNLDMIAAGSRSSTPTTCPIAISRTSRPPRTMPAPRSAGCGRRMPVRHIRLGAKCPRRRRTQ